MRAVPIMPTMASVEIAMLESHPPSLPSAPSLPFSPTVFTPREVQLFPSS